MHFKQPKKETKARTERTAKPATNSTMKVSYDMFKEGMSIAEIAVKRSLAPTTIETHLAAYVAAGELDIHRFVGKEKLEKILATIKLSGQSIALKPIKDLLDEEYTFGEIRMALEYYKKVGG